MLRPIGICISLVLLVVTQVGCEDEGGAEQVDVHAFAQGCYAVVAVGPAEPTPKTLVSDGPDAYVFRVLTRGQATPFFLKPSRLGTYLLRDPLAGFLVSDGTALERSETLDSDVRLVDDSYESDAEWVFESRHLQPSELVLKHRASGKYLTTVGVSDIAASAATVQLHAREGCADFPEASLDAEGEVAMTEWPDGDVFGIVDTHSHVLSNFGFGGGGIFHGAPFHALGVEHALSDCALYHGEAGRQDLFGFGFDQGSDLDSATLLTTFATGQTPEDNHATDGWPTFTDWPSTWGSSTHQTQYYRWLERAWMGGLRLVVLHATTNQIICDFLVGQDVQPVRYDCNDMVAVDRIIDESYEMQGYIDAQEGGPGEGWFRIVKTPAEAREVIRGGKLAVILGIETSNLFDCFLTPSEEHPACTEQDVIDRLDDYHARGVRAVFPVHKYDNGFSAGDGQKLFIELGNFIQTGHWSNYTEECDPINTAFDRGVPSFIGINMPRDVYDSPAPNDLSGFQAAPFVALTPFLTDELILGPAGTVEMCQKAGLTSLGEFLIDQLMDRGMIIEIDHLPRRSYKRTFEKLSDADYPAAGTHGLNNDGELYALGGVSKTGFGRCRDSVTPSTVDDGFQSRIALIEQKGGYPAEGFGFDLNGFAGGPGPRMGPDSGCNQEQADPVTYPFTSYAGDIEFTAPQLGTRMVDFNTEGLTHIGLLPELLEEVRGDGVSDDDLEPLFRSAEGYLRMWEKAEQRGLAMAP